LSDRKRQKTATFVFVIEFRRVWAETWSFPVKEIDSILTLSPVDQEGDLLLGLGEVLDPVVDRGAPEALRQVGVGDGGPRPGDVPQRQGGAGLDLGLGLLQHVADLRRRQLLVSRELDFLDDRPFLDRDDQGDARGLPLGIDPDVLEQAHVPEGVEVGRTGRHLMPRQGDRVGRHRLVADDAMPRIGCWPGGRRRRSRPEAGPGLGRRRGRSGRRFLRERGPKTQRRRGEDRGRARPPTQALSAPV
jgi:hypothetical protein